MRHRPWPLHALGQLVPMYTLASSKPVFVVVAKDQRMRTRLPGLKGMVRVTSCQVRYDDESNTGGGVHTLHVGVPGEQPLSWLAVPVHCKPRSNEYWKASGLL